MWCNGKRWTDCSVDAFSEDGPAAHFKRFAAAFGLHALEQSLNAANLASQIMQFGQFPIGELAPASFCGNCRAKTEEQSTNFLKAESGLTRLLNHGEAIKRDGVVAAAAADAIRARKEAKLFVVADGGRPQPHPARDLGNGEAQHAIILNRASRNTPISMSAGERGTMC